MWTVLLVAGATLVTLGVVFRRLHRKNLEMDASAIQVLGLRPPDAEAGKSDVQRPQLQAAPLAAGHRNQDITRRRGTSQGLRARTRLELAVAVIRGAVSPSAFQPKSKRLPPTATTDDDPTFGSGSGSSGAPATVHAYVEPRRRPPGRPERS
jgi:hypothetical protein